MASDSGLPSSDGIASGPPGIAPPPPGISPPGPPPQQSDHVHHDIARDIGQQVEVMILEAKRNSETKVGKEIQKIKIKMESMNDKIKRIMERVNQVEPNNGGLLKTDLQKSIAKLEEVWETEVGTLKHELWQTIQAHNHNADLLKHHKDAIDQISTRMTDTPANPELEQANQQYLQVEKIMQKEAAKELQMEQLIQRLSVIQQQLAGAGGMNPWAAAGVAPSLFAMPGQAAMASGMAAGAPGGKKAQRKDKTNAKGKGPKPTAAASQLNSASLRAEAPEFVPTFG